MARRILVVDDDPGIAKILSDRLKHKGFEVKTALDGAKGLAQIKDTCPDVVLLDLQMPGVDGMHVLRKLKEQHHDGPVIVVTAFGTIRRAVEAIKAGAYDFLTKPLELDLVELTIKRALEHNTLRSRLQHLQEQADRDVPKIITLNPAMRELLSTAQRVASRNTTLLLLGETGTGKEVLARAVHKWSPRCEGPFVAVNCAAIPEQLLESELFGYEKGAFTGADKLKRGRFELASEGTLFLDEIGEMHPALQAKLLRVLEGHGFQRVGGNVTLHSYARIIAASNQKLSDAVNQGRFREDLYHRLNVVAIEIPPLRQRREDIADLVHSFVAKYCTSTKQPQKKISLDALEVLRRYPWPGNVRELENAIERAVVLTSESEIHIEDLPEHIIESVAMVAECNSKEPHGYHAAVSAYKRRLIRDALRQVDGNQTEAARLLGLQRTYLARLIRNLNVGCRQKMDN
jgi:DNA-binding NtrC family response regulator